MRLSSGLFCVSALIASTMLGACAHRTSVVEELFAADRAFSARSMEIGAGPAFVEFASDDVRAFPNGGETLKGKPALADWTSDWSRERSISWEPEEAFASASGDFGYTWGYATFERKDDAGQSILTYGKYVTIWRRQPDGQWKWIADLGNGAPAPDARLQD
ncbi:MAG: DUF4440 domain-containing protein [Pseudomonadota bacterium]